MVLEQYSAKQTFAVFRQNLKVIRLESAQRITHHPGPWCYDPPQDAADPLEANLGAPPMDVFTEAAVHLIVFAGRQC
jgi:hypothetical protein